MAFGNEIRTGSSGQSTGFYNNIVRQSLRFTSEDSSYLYKTPSSGNQKVFTWAAWVKKCQNGVQRGIWSVGNNAQFSLFFHSDDSLRVWTNGGNGAIYTNNLFRDLCGWFHIALTSGNSSPYFNLYLNGVKCSSFSYDNRSNYPGSSNTEVSDGSSQHHIGACNNGGLAYFDGQLADIHFLDGTEVGSTNDILDEFVEIKRGICIPKKYTGSYGTRGYHLEFKQTGTGTASASTVGADTSGNGEHYTSSGLSSHDANLPDCPENNFATLNRLIKPHDALTFNQGNLKTSRGSGSLVYSFAASTIAVKTGKWYAEWRPTGSQTAANHMVGISTVDNPDQSAGDPYLENGQINYVANGSGHIDDGGNVSAGTFSSSNSYGSGDVVGVALDLDSGTKNVKFYKNGSQVNSTNLSSEFNDKHIYFYHVFYNTNTGMWNFGQDSTFGGDETAATNADDNGIGAFHESVPSGYLALCTENLSDDDLAISPNENAHLTRSAEHFDTVVSVGNNTDNTDITNTGPAGGGSRVTEPSTLQFKPDLIFTFANSNASHNLATDSSRGAGYDQYISAASGQGNDTAGIKAFNSNGFRVGTSTNHNVNSRDYFRFCFRANGGSKTSHSAGDNSATEASTSQANTTAGISIVEYTGDTSDHGTTYPSTFNHGLGKTPKLLIVKANAAVNWAVYHEDMNPGSSYNHVQALNATTGRSTANNAYWGGNTMTLNNNLFSAGSDNTTGANGTDYIAYIFAEVEGFSKIGKFTGNASTDGAFVYTGFRPQHIITKASVNASAWHAYDANSDVNPVGFWRYNETTSYQDYNYCDICCNGFKIRDNGTEANRSQEPFIYIAFASSPFKYANAHAGNAI